MTDDDLEMLMQRRNFEPLPAEWRTQILSAAYAARADVIAADGAVRMAWVERFTGWRGLAAVWAIIALLHFANEAPAINPPPLAVSFEAWRRHLIEEHRWLAELGRPDEPPSPAHASAAGAKSSSRERSSQIPVSA